MNISVVYLHVARTPMGYSGAAWRFAHTYQRFEAGEPHQLTVVVCNGTIEPVMQEMFSRLGAKFDEYGGTGEDIGAQQFACRKSEADWVVCLSSRSFFHRAGWLTRFKQEWVAHGEGFYGAMASYEKSPHIRTCCYAMTPNMARNYPHTINSREQALSFEHGEWSATEWSEAAGFPVLMVAWDAAWTRPYWRHPDNVFRKGDQSNCLTWDKHTEVFRQATPDVKIALEALADGKMNPDE